MFDLSGIARHLKLTVEQIRSAADLLEQGFSPTFIERYRGDETGSLSRTVLERLKYEIERRKRTEAAKQRALKQLPKDAVLDAEWERAIGESHSALAVDVAARCYRARRALDQSQERSGLAGKLLEAMLTYSGPPIDDIQGWILGQIGDEGLDAETIQSQLVRLVSALMHSDTSLNSKLRQYIERNATITVVDAPESALTAHAASEEEAQEDDHADHAEHHLDGSESEDSDFSHQDGEEAHLDTDHLAAGQVETHLVETHLVETHSEPGSPNEVSSEATAISEGPLQDLKQVVQEEIGSDQAVEASPVASGHAENISNEATPPKAHASAALAKAPSKMTPRQRRRRWLLSVLQSMRTIRKPLNKLTAYQQLLLARGVRSHLIATPLDFDPSGLVDIARNSFTEAKHPFAEWFRHAVGHAMEHGLRARLEADALADLEERASESLLEHATDDLRHQLMRRPVRGHTIALIDTVGPKSVCVVFVGATGKVLGCEELPCSVIPEIVGQNVVKLGEWVHKHRVTLVALTNGPARRFMLATLREFMQQSKESGLRWTMADRSGAEAYAGGRIGLRELSIYNRRQRAAIWAARCLQDPLVELLKVDISRLRLGSYQRELPQDALRRQIYETLASCVCARGIDTQNASEFELQFVPGVRADQAKQIVQLAKSGCLVSRSQLALDVQNWPESDRRHALGWLRVFGSQTTLDATLIHPEDYRLAERLLEHTDLNNPPAAPTGWIKRNAEPIASTKVTSDAERPGDVPQPSDVVSGDELPNSMDGVASPTVDDSGPSENDNNDNVLQGSPEQLVAPSAAVADGSPAERGSPADGVGDAIVADPVVSVDADQAEEGLTFRQTANEAEGPLAGHAANRPLPEYPEQCSETSAPSLTFDCDKLANQWQVGRAKLRMVASCLANPFEDPRLSGVPGPLLTEMPTLDNLQPEMCLWAIVVGVADFGAFVELGPNCSGLIHISRLSSHFIEDPHQCVQVGDLLMTWVVNIDRKKNRVALTAISPAEREQMKVDAEARKAREESERQQRDRGYHRSQHGEQRYPRPQGQGQPDRSAGDATSGSGGQGSGRGTGRDATRSGSRGSDSSRQGSGPGQTPRFAERSHGRRPSGNRGGQAGGDRGRGRDSGGRSSKSVVVTSKKPVAPISQAMKQGDEPLRSFSDLMQFYESKRAPDAPSSLEVQPSTPAVDLAVVEVAGEQIAKPHSDPTASVTQVVESDSPNSGDE